MLHSEFMGLGFYIMFFPVVFLYGICIGSFLNVVIYRLPNEESLVKRASHCPKCGEKIRWYDNIPLISWLIILRGKCRKCGQPISKRYPIVEALNGIVYVVTFAVMDFNLKSVLYCFFFSVLICLGFMDWDTMEIDLRVLAVILVLTIPAHFLMDLTIVQRLIGAACISIPFFLIGEGYAVYSKKKNGEAIRGIELGDTYLMACAGLYLGWKAMIPAAAIGILLAAFFGLILKKVTGESKFAFGPYLCAGLLIGAMFGDELTNWYLERCSLLVEPQPVQYYSSMFLR